VGIQTLNKKLNPQWEGPNRRNLINILRIFSGEGFITTENGWTDVERSVRVKAR